MSKIISKSAALFAACLFMLSACSNDDGDDNSKSSVTKGAFKDSRDGKVYKTVKIGIQTWFAENLKYNASGSKCYGEGGEVVAGYDGYGEPIKDDYGNLLMLSLTAAEIQANCEKYGRLYDRNAAKTVCPSGWHLSSESEWRTLGAYISSDKNCSSCDAKHLKATSGWDDYYADEKYGNENTNEKLSGNGEDTYGFAALPGGGGSGREFYGGVGRGGSWWSYYNENSMSTHLMSSEWDYTNRDAPGGLMSVRCLRGNESMAAVEPSSVVKGTFTDARDGEVYKTVKIGTQTWFAENLKYNSSGGVCYDNDPANCEKYGRLYDWNAARIACPSGWHLPRLAEWGLLTVYVVADNGHVGPEVMAGKALKATSGWNDTDYGTSGNGLDTYGFAALPGGEGRSDGSFGNAGYEGYWWSVSEYGASDAYYWYMNLSDGASWDGSGKSDLLSVRCLQD